MTPLGHVSLTWNGWATQRSAGRRSSRVEDFEGRGSGGSWSVRAVSSGGAGGEATTACRRTRQKRIGKKNPGRGLTREPNRRILAFVYRE